jgi:tRNA-Thr(GGU) m(6)t(6)A37 methyltransferase TsaA
MELVLKPIGVIHSPYTAKQKAPIQPRFSQAEGRIEVFPEYEEGLTDIEGFSHIVILYYFHQSEGYNLLVRPFLDEAYRGLFATRSPRRPNPIGLSVVTLLERRGNILCIGQVDALDGTPLLDIKPYVPAFDQPQGVRIGWLTGKIY